MPLPVRQYSFNPATWLVTLALGVILIALSVLGLVSLFMAYPATSLVTDLSNPSHEETLTELQIAVQQIDKARAYEQGRRQLFNDQAILLLRLNHQLKAIRKNDQASMVLEKMRLTLLSSLRQSPGDANHWYLLAEIAALQGKFNRSAKRYLGMSYLTGPREGWIALRRLSFSLRYWLLLDDRLRHHARKEIRTLWSTASYHSTFMRQFSDRGGRAQKLIYRVIKSYGEEQSQIFLKLAKRAGWNLATLNSVN